MSLKIVSRKGTLCHTFRHTFQPETMRADSLGWHVRCGLLASILSLSLFSIASADDTDERIAPAPLPEQSAREQIIPEPSRDFGGEIDTGEYDTCGCQECVGRAGGLSGWLSNFKSRMQASHWGYREYFHERPLGSLMKTNMETQVFNGYANQLALYQYDFQQGGAEERQQLSSRGERQLRRLARLVELTGQPIMLQKSSDNVALDEARRQSVLRQLETLEFPVSPDLVVVSELPIFGLGGIAERHFPNQTRWGVTYRGRLQQLEERGSRILQPQIGIIR